MLESLLYYLRESWNMKIPMVFHYTSTKMMLSVMTALMISIFLGPWFIRKLYELKIGQSIRSEEYGQLGELHANKKDTPTMGGLLILFSMLVTMILWMDLTNIFTLILLVTTIFLGTVGGIDDFLKIKYKNAKGLPGKNKLAAQFLISSLVAAYLLFPGVGEWMREKTWYSPPVIKEETIKRDSRSMAPFQHERQGDALSTLTLKEYASRVYIPFIKEPVVNLTGGLTAIAFLFILFVIIGSSNAVNLTDGLDGLATGCLLMVAVCLATIAFLSNNRELAGYLNILYVEGSGDIAIYLCSFAGACLGFLWYNGYPAQVFMGDTGSLALGGIIGVCAVLLKREFLLGIIGGIFVLEALSVIIQVASFKLRNKKRVFLIAPLHHHFEYKGWPETKVVIRFWIIGLLLALIGMASLKFQ